MKQLVVVFVVSVLVSSAWVPAAPPPLRVASATLLALAAHRDEPGSRLYFCDDVRRSVDQANGMGDLTYMRGMFACRKFNGDRSSLVDLGEHAWAQIATLPPQARTHADRVPAIAGHVYLAHVDDQEVDFWAMFRATRIVADDHCDVEWVRLDRTPAADAPALSSDAQSRLAELLVRQDDNLDPALVLRSPSIVLQVRTGATGGNPSRIDMAGRTTVYVDRVSDVPLHFDAAPQMQDRSVAYADGGRLPPGKRLVIRSITYRGTAKGDTNGHGSLIVRAGKVVVCDKRDVAEVAETRWTGHIEIRPGEEHAVYLEVANSSAADVQIDGEWVDDATPPR